MKDLVDDVEWYLMSMTNQKTCLYILFISQVGKPLTFWDLDEVTVTTYVKVKFLEIKFNYFSKFEYISRSLKQFTFFLRCCTILNEKINIRR